ncbi:MAG: rhomboid family intramembrane serine protease [Flavobacteriales bacterium]|nr:rhomboid family intramembrane serine protease [Flavobacteriales bacterium]
MLESPVTYIIIALTAFVSWKAMDDTGMKLKLLMNPNAVVRRNEWSRVFTHALVHGDWMHLFFNMFVLYSFGTIVEQIFSKPELGFMGFGKMGHVLFIALYIGGIIFASIPSLIKHRDNPNYNSLGASGAVFAVMTAFVIMLPLEKLLLFFVLPIPGWVALALMFVFEYSMQKRGGTGIAHDAHLWGAAFGVIFMMILNVDYILNFFRQITSVFS